MANKNQKPVITLKKSSSLKTKTRWRRRVFFLFGSCIFIITTIYLNRINILLTLGSMLIYQDPPEACDVIVLLGGGGPNRAERAVELFQNGYADRMFIALMKEPSIDVLDRDLINMESLEIQSVLYENYIPEKKQFWCDVPFYSTFGEAQYVRYWLEKRGYDKAVIVTGLFQSQRAKWTFDFFMEGSGIKTVIVPEHGKTYSEKDWWTNINGIIFVENELLKSAYYYLRFLVQTPEPYSPTIQ